MNTGGVVVDGQEPVILILRVRMSCWLDTSWHLDISRNGTEHLLGQFKLIKCTHSMVLATFPLATDTERSPESKSHPTPFAIKPLRRGSESKMTDQSWVRTPVIHCVMDSGWWEQEKAPFHRVQQKEWTGIDKGPYHGQTGSKIWNIRRGTEATGQVKLKAFQINQLLSSG